MTCLSTKLLFTGVAALFLVVGAQDEGETGPVYGIDESWPMQSARAKNEEAQARYEKYMSGCVDFYSKNGLSNACQEWEANRIRLNNEQPPSMINFTENGFDTFRAPEYLVELLDNFWDANRGKEVVEDWSTILTGMNVWDAPTKLLEVGDNELEGGGFWLEQHIINGVRAIVEEWTGQRQVDKSLAGVRIFTSGAITAPQVEEIPSVTFALINIAQDLDEPWPIELIGHDGKAHSVTLEPGEILVCESHSVINGFPFPLKGRFMANLYVYFDPIGPLDEPIDYSRQLPPYFTPDSKAAETFLSENPDGYLDGWLDEPDETTAAHAHAGEGNIEGLTAVLAEDELIVRSRDENGWTPLAVAAYTEQEEAVETLLERGSDHNALLGENRDGGSILWMAKTYLGEDHPIVERLEAWEARDIAPLDDSGLEDEL